jgi:hypothetical protein
VSEVPTRSTTPRPPWAFEIRFYADAAGAPGALLQTHAVGNAVSRAAVGLLGGTLTEYAYTASLGAGFEPTKQSTLTAMDYLQIQQLISSYGHALDSGYGKGENGEAYADSMSSAPRTSRRTLRPPGVVPQ